MARNSLCLQGRHREKSPSAVEFRARLTLYRVRLRFECCNPADRDIPDARFDGGESNPGWWRNGFLCLVAVKSTAAKRGVKMAQEFQMERFTKAFLEFEVDHDLFSITVKEHCFWEYIRYSVFYQCVFSHYGNPYRRNLRPFTYVVDGFRSLRLLVRFWRTDWGQYDILAINYDRSSVIDGKKRNIHLYPFIKELADEYKILLVDRSLTNRIDDDAYPCPILEFRPFHFIDRMKSYLVRFEGREQEAMGEIGKKVKDRFGVDVDILLLARSVFAFQLQVRRRYLRILREYSPRMVVYADDANMKGVISAAKTLGIPTVDIQHSLVSSLNILYTYSDTSGVHDRTIRSDYIFTYGSFWREQYRLPVKIVSVGFPYFDERIRKTPQFAGDRTKNIIIIGQRISKAAVVETALALAELLPDYTLYYKLRIEEYEDWRLSYPESFSTTPNLKVIDSHATGLYEWFTRCRYQVGINSTALCEGLAFGLTTFILKTEWYAEMAALIQSECVFLVSSAAEIAERIRENAQPRGKVVTEQLFRPESLRNIREATERILLEAVKGEGEYRATERIADHETAARPV